MLWLSSLTCLLWVIEYIGNFFYLNKYRITAISKSNPHTCVCLILAHAKTVKHRMCQSLNYPTGELTVLLGLVSGLHLSHTLLGQWRGQ